MLSWQGSGSLDLDQALVFSRQADYGRGVLSWQGSGSLDQALVFAAMQAEGVAVTGLAGQAQVVKSLL